MKIGRRKGNEIRERQEKRRKTESKKIKKCVNRQLKSYLENYVYKTWIIHWWKVDL